MSDRARALMAQRRFSEAARLFEQSRDHARAIEAYRQAGEPAEAGRLLFTDGQYEEAANTLLGAVPEAVKRGSRPSPEVRQAMRSAAVAFARAVRPLQAASLYLRLGERDRAVQVLTQAGRQAEADHVAAGGEVLDDPLIGSARPGSARRSVAMVRSPHERLALLMVTEPADPLYMRRALDAARIAAENDLLDFELENWLRPWLQGNAAGQGKEDVDAMLDLAMVYESRELLENAELILQSALRLDPDHRDVHSRLDAVRARRLGEGSDRLGAIFEADRTFMEAGTMLRPTQMNGVDDGLESLPRLPSLPQLSEPGLSPPSAPPAATVEASHIERLSSDEWYLEIDAASSPNLSSDEAAVWATKKTIDPRTLTAGDVVAERYRILRRLGKGGMGVVFAVHDEMLNEDVALKIIFNPDENAGDVARFKDEMKICRRLNHRNIVRVFEFGLWRGSHFLTMELLAGQDLDALMKGKRGGPMAVDSMLPLMVQVCDGLAAAHKHGVIHRDIKPGNLFVTKDNALKLMDFGIAKAHAFDISITQTGMLVGTPAFIAPERVLGESADTPQSDLYALGIVMYQLTTGRMPFVAREMPKLFIQHVQEVPMPPSQRNPVLPGAVSDIVMKLLEKRPEDRFQSAMELRRALEQAWAVILRSR